VCFADWLHSFLLSIDEDGAPLTRSDVDAVVGSCMKACMRSHMSDMGSRAKVSTSNLMFDINI
jgi:hypothetical protein